MALTIGNFGIKKVTLAVLIIVTVAFSWLKPIDLQAEQQVDAGLKRALVTFAVARTLNGIISVAQGTELSVEPLGFGVTLTIGQILDPVNDLVEKFSTLMLIASVAFGVEKMLLNMGATWFVSLFFSGFAFVWCGLYLYGKPIPRWLTCIVTIFVITRIFVPLTLAGSGWIFNDFMRIKYETGQAEIAMISNQLLPREDVIAEGAVTADSNKTTTTTKKPSAFDWILGKSHSGEVTENDSSATPPIAGTNKQPFWSTLDPQKKIEHMKHAVGKIPEYIIELMVIFILQTIVLPILLLWAFVSVSRSYYPFTDSLLASIRSKQSG